jgi:pilus assembly protein CpaF
MASAVTTHYWSPIAHLFDDESITDVYVVQFDRIAIRQKGQLVRVEGGWPTAAAFTHALVHLARASDIELEEGTGGVFDAMLGTIRVNAGLPPRALQAHATLRIPRKEHYTLEQLETNGMIPVAMRACIRRCLDARLNVMISGITGSGKTTLLRAFVPYGADEKMTFIIEDTAELNLTLPLMVHHTAQFDPKRSDEQADPSVASIYSALRSAPDQVILGEIRRPKQLLAFLRVLACGFQGSATMHSTPGPGVLNRAQEMLMEEIRFQDPAGYSAMFLNNVHVLLHCEDMRTIGRRVVRFDWVDPTRKDLRNLYVFHNRTLRSDATGIEAFLRHTEPLC